MKSYKSAMQTWDMLTLLGLGWETYLYFSDDSKETTVNYRNTGFAFIPRLAFKTTSEEGADILEERMFAKS